MQEKCWKDNRMNSNRLIILIFLIIFSHQSWTMSDDIKEFEIEGISIGDSALDYYSKKELRKFNKTYFPNTYSDFNEASPGMVFIEQAAAIGDVLSFYQDTQLKESMLVHASERKNVVALAQAMGYKPKISTPAVTTLTVYQLVLAKNDATFSPDENYYLKVKAGLEAGLILAEIPTV